MEGWTTQTHPHPHHNHHNHHNRRSVKSAGGPRSLAGRSQQQQQQQQQQGRGGRGAGGVRLAAGGGEPMDLLDAAASRQLVRSAAGEVAEEARPSTASLSAVFYRPRPLVCGCCEQQPQKRKRSSSPLRLHFSSNHECNPPPLNRWPQPQACGRRARAAVLGSPASHATPPQARWSLQRRTAATARAARAASGDAAATRPATTATTATLTT